MATETTVPETARGRGRPREFDEQEVLDALVQLFWERGFEAASLADIVEAAGLNKSSLYNSFGSKDALFALVLERYMARRTAMLSELMAGDGGLDKLAEFFEMQRAEMRGSTGSMGCLAVNATTELGPRDARVAEMATGYRRLLAEGLRGPLERAAAAGEIDPFMVDAYLDVLVGSTVSLSVAARGGAPDEELLRMIDSMERVARSWRRR